MSTEAMPWSDHMSSRSHLTLGRLGPKGPEPGSLGCNSYVGSEVNTGFCISPSGVAPRGLTEEIWSPSGGVRWPERMPNPALSSMRPSESPAHHLARRRSSARGSSGRRHRTGPKASLGAVYRGEWSLSQERIQVEPADNSGGVVHPFVHSFNRIERTTVDRSD